MKFLATISIMPHKELLDPQGKTASKNMKNIGLSNIHDVRIGKRIEMTLEASSKKEAEEATETACKKMLANTIMEAYNYEIKEIA